MRRVQMKYRLYVLLATMAAVALPAGAPAPGGPPPAPRLQPPPPPDAQPIMPAQTLAPPPPVKPKTAAKPKPAALPPSENPPPDDSAVPVARPAAPPKPAEPARVVACSNGAFAKNSGHLRLAQSFGVHNVDYTEVSGDDGSTLLASVLFPTDPKRRLEVLWDDDVERSGTRMIVIDGQSTWSAQKGVHLGLPLAALEKLNGKPFKLMGFEKGGMAIVSDWNGGALRLLTDGSKVGVPLKPD